ncbi:lysophospholipid acyltransferase family protein [Nocardia sp. NPDC050710]|uniref:lysophospholipid acyltransferase family protein n=1 Tax=Nocardia sp. NPDC050710 TaxID=3157220 RepID=UPI0034083CD4
MNDVAKVIHLHDLNVEPRQRVSARRWPEPVTGDSTPGRVTSLTERLAAAEPPEPHSLSDMVRGLVGQQIGKTADFARRRLTGDYQIDDFGFDEHLLESVILPALRPISDHWFRVQVNGMRNIPEVGGALIVANHAGTVPLDGLMLQLAIHDHHAKQRALRLLAADLIFEMPLLGSLARKAGHTLACREDAERLLRSGELTGVFPEGFKGVGKQYSDRYKLQRFGRGGFVAAAVRTGVPIIPCSIVGSEEIYPKLADLKPLARLLGLPYFPVTPLFPHLGPLGAVPLPSKWYIEFGTPIPTAEYEPEAADDPMTMFEVTDQVRETIQQTLYKLLNKRRNAFTG